jgi:hypothetical protein
MVAEMLRPNAFVDGGTSWMKGAVGIPEDHGAALKRSCAHASHFVSGAIRGRARLVLLV